MANGIEKYKKWVPNNISLEEMRFPTEESERLRQQALLTLETDRAYINRLNIGPSDRVLDLGCGTGIYTMLISELLHPLETIGVDINGILILARKLSAAKEARNVTFTKGNAMCLKFGDNHFQTVFSRLLLHHVDDPLKVMREVRRVLRPNGQALVIDTDGTFINSPESPAFTRMFSAYETLVAKKGGNRKIGLQVGDLLKSAGFADIEVSKELFDFDRREFMEVVLPIFPNNKEEMITAGIIPEADYDHYMAELEDYGKNRLQRLQIPLYYWTARKPG